MGVPDDASTTSARKTGVSDDASSPRLVEACRPYVDNMIRKIPGEGAYLDGINTRVSVLYEDCPVILIIKNSAKGSLRILCTKAAWTCKILALTP